MNTRDLVVLGAGGGISQDSRNIDRAGPAWAVEMDDEWLLFDCGRLSYQRMLKSDLDPGKLSSLFVTHLHSDHVVGLPDFVLTSWITYGVSKWNLIGPSPLQRHINALFGTDGAYSDDIVTRSQSPLSTKSQIQPERGKDLHPPSFNVTEVSSEGVVARGSDWEVIASFSPNHVQPWLNSVAYRVNWSDGSVVFTGDTGPSAEIAAFARGCDVLVHECSISSDSRTGVFADNAIHTDPRGLGWVAEQAQAKTVVLTHYTVSVDRPEILASFETEVKESFSGRVVIGDDLRRLNARTGEIIT